MSVVLGALVAAFFGGPALASLAPLLAELAPEPGALTTALAEVRELRNLDGSVVTLSLLLAVFAALATPLLAEEA